MVTFLWRQAGSPKATSAKNPFTDVSENAYYYDAVIWAVENGITNGVTETTFAPNDKVTRAQTVTFLHRKDKSPDVNGTLKFNDVQMSSFYAKAVIWATEAGITNGTTAATFDPNDPCTRAQIVTFMYRNSAK